MLTFWEYVWATIKWIILAVAVCAGLIWCFGFLSKLGEVSPAKEDGNKPNAEEIMKPKPRTPKKW
jgi:hypothetical protein